MAIDARIVAAEAQLKELETQRDANLGKIANYLDPAVPISKDEKDNAVVYKTGECRMEEGLYHHHELLWMIDGYEPEVCMGLHAWGSTCCLLACRALTADSVSGFSVKSQFLLAGACAICFVSRAVCFPCCCC